MRNRKSQLKSPFLREISLNENSADGDLIYPFNLALFRNGFNLEIKERITFFVGENGSGKSTLLEAVAKKCGFNLQGGGKNNYYGTTAHDIDPLVDQIKLAWFPKTPLGFFLRAESLFNFASYLDEVVPGALGSYGGVSLHEMSHGEAFLALFLNRFNEGLFILDEPEAALSPQRQLSFLRILWELDRAGKSQFLIATHSPILLAYPQATIFSLYKENFEVINYTETEHFQLYRDFLTAPQRFLSQLFVE